MVGGNTVAIPELDDSNVENELAEVVSEAGNSTAESTTRLPSYQLIRETPMAPVALARIAAFKLACAD